MEENFQEPQKGLVLQHLPSLKIGTGQTRTRNEDDSKILLDKREDNKRGHVAN